MRSLLFTIVVFSVFCGTFLFGEDMSYFRRDKKITLKDGKEITGTIIMKGPRGVVVALPEGNYDLQELIPNGKIVSIVPAGTKDKSSSTEEKNGEADSENIAEGSDKDKNDEASSGSDSGISDSPPEPVLEDVVKRGVLPEDGKLVLTDLSAAERAEKSSSQLIGNTRDKSFLPKNKKDKGDWPENLFSGSKSKPNSSGIDNLFPDNEKQNKGEPTPTNLSELIKHLF